MNTESLLRVRYWVLGLIAIISAAFLVPLSKMGVEMDNSPERFAASDDVAFVELAQLQKSFGRDDFFAILIEGDVFSPAFFASLKKRSTSYSCT